MHIKENVSLALHSTMRIGGPARYMAEIDSFRDLREAVEWTKNNNQKAMVLGGGSNSIFTDRGFDGIVLLMQIKGVELIEDTDDFTMVKIGAGENWDDAVAKTVEWGLSGIEALSLIPGTAGGTPVQNVGAYGQEISQVFYELDAYDLRQNRIIQMSKDDCKFSYRNSVFKHVKDRRYIITSITLKLRKNHMKPPFYAALQNYLDKHNISDYSPAAIRKAIIEIRTSKMPDPAKIANTGSFFKNPVLSKDQYVKVKDDYPNLPGYEDHTGNVKIPAAWLLEKAGYKGFRSENGMGIYDKHPLVFINEGATSYKDLLEFKNEITRKIEAQFGITLEQEPETID